MAPGVKDTGPANADWYTRLAARFATRLTRRGWVILAAGVVLFANAVLVNSRDMVFVASLLTLSLIHI